MTFPNVKAQLVDARTIDQLEPILIKKMGEASFIGFDLETEDSNAHDGIKEYRGGNTARVFDINRTNICGFSLYADNDDTSYYVNLMHADVNNRISWPRAKALLDARKSDSYFIAHNAPFELTMMGKSLEYEIEKIICTLQMAVTAYGPDEYSRDAFYMAGLGGIQKLLPEVARQFHGYSLGAEMTSEQSELLYKVVAKTSDADHSYNGFVKNIAYGYGLKKIVKSFFNHQMQTFQETLGGREHMGQLTGEEVCAYGADDSVWAVRLFHRLLQYMAESNPAVINTFFEQENPMVHVYSDVWRTGMVVNTENVVERRKLERGEAAKLTRSLKATVNKLLPFPDEPNAGMMEHDGKWFAKNDAWKRKRRQITDWAALPDVASDFEQIRQAAGAVSNAWSAESGFPKPTGVNLAYWQTTRSLIYDLLDQRPMREAGKVQSDADARDKLVRRIDKQIEEATLQFASDAAAGVATSTCVIDRLNLSKELIKGLNDMAGIDQRMKLYLTPYVKLMDPDTKRMYPSLSSQLATRRLASSNPNPMQLAKNGPSSFIRGFYLPDQEDHVLVSIDWSQIELVLIGEFSGDPEFAKAYGQRPYEDLHTGAAADCLGITVEELRARPDYKKLRTDVGKGANFNYWYSGALSTVGENLGWSPDRMWEATDKYRQRFAVAEAWRLQTIREVQTQGFVELPDHTRRYRFEATPTWEDSFFERFHQLDNDAIDNFIRMVIRKVQRRAGNQAVNAKIQGSCATLAKRSILRILQEIKRGKWDARFKIPIHDELLFSVHRSQVVAFVKVVKSIMLDHPDIISSLKIDATASVGLTFEPWKPGARFGQIELDEAPGGLDFVKKDTVMNDNEIGKTVDFLFEQRLAA